jgi:NAD(P) transhydrogenase subunit beta
MNTLTHTAYLAAIILFVLGLKGLSSARTARRGNRLAAAGMLLAVCVTLFDSQILDYTYILVGLALGSALGTGLAVRIRMTAMPQVVAAFNGLGGAASALVAFSEHLRSGGEAGAGSITAALAASLLIGTITFTGSFAAFLKLQGILRGRTLLFGGRRTVPLLLLFLAAGAALLMQFLPDAGVLPLIVVLAAALLGVFFVLPIGGADMPVVIALLNACSGLAAAATGFVLTNYMLIVAGALVGASGFILTQIMCRAMNRSLGNVVFGAVKVPADSGDPEEQREPVTGYEPEDAVTMLDNAQSVIIVPGYGMAVAQAQHALHELESLLAARGVRVRYAIHPVAGRMPGHMNVLLAEANVSYDLLFTMEDINEEFAQTDVALVVGANDVINPAARAREDSPLYGMPILNVDRAGTVLLLKRSLSPGFSGVDNDLFRDPKTMMIFQDAKEALTRIVALFKE